MTVILRPMRPDDVDAVWSLEQRLFAADAWPRLVLERELKSQLRHYIALEKVDDNVREIVAYAGLLVVPPLADIQTIGVVPEYEGKGFGALMLEELIKEARHRGAENVLLEVRHDNDRAQRLYRRFGFEVIEVRKRYYSSGNDAKVMKKKLGEDRSSEVGRVFREPGAVGSEVIRKKDGLW